MSTSLERDLVGAVADDTGTWFRIWAPGAERVEVVLERGAAYVLNEEAEGWFAAHLEQVRAGALYRLRLNGTDSYPDPYSRSQPQGVHGPSQVIDLTAFEWTDDAWPGRALDELIIHELHVGTATPEGTFDALVERLPYFVELGVTALEIMPVAEFPGSRNWGYDGVYLFAPAQAYGGADGMRRFIDAAHRLGLAVILDVVYNHFGPEGNFLPAVTGGRIFTERHHTPWGAAVNYDDDGADAVRAIVLENVRHWVQHFHVDGLRLDATHAIVDTSDTHILEEIAATAKALAHRPISVIAEDERNERRLLLPVAGGGYGLDAVWADDTHHSLRRLVAGDDEGYYSAYDGTIAEVVTALQRGWLYQGEHYAPTAKSRGTRADGLPPTAFVHCIQNHDQVGNRALGERLNHHVNGAVYRAVSALLLLTPYTPLLWMGQEWAATTPFLYFTDHPEELGRQVTQGRREEFKRFSQFADAQLCERIPDPQAAATFERSKLRWDELERQPHAGVLALYRELIALRRQHAALRRRGRASFAVEALGEAALGLKREGVDGATLLLVIDIGGAVDIDLARLAPDRPLRVRLWTEHERFGGAGGVVSVDGTRLSMPAAGAVLLEA
jgi:maltooligosyltrehalose trehalohydrolase